MTGARTTANYALRVATQAADRLAEIDAEVARLRAAREWEPFDGSGPDVDPVSGDERATSDAEGRPL